MIGQCDRPRDLVIYTFAVAGALIAGYTLYGMAGEKFTQWFVKDAMPRIQAQTESEFQMNGLVTTNFDGSSLGSGFGSSGGFNSGGGQFGGE